MPAWNMAAACTPYVHSLHSLHHTWQGLHPICAQPTSHVAGVSERGHAVSLIAMMKVPVTMVASVGMTPHVHPPPCTPPVQSSFAFEYVSVRASFMTGLLAFTVAQVTARATYGYNLHLVTVTARITYGYSLYHVRLQLTPRTVTARITYGYSLRHAWTRPLLSARLHPCGSTPAAVCTRHSHQPATPARNPSVRLARLTLVTSQALRARFALREAKELSWAAMRAAV